MRWSIYELIYRLTYLIQGPIGIRFGSARIRSGFVRDLFGVRAGSVWGPRGVRSAWFRVRSGSARGPFRVRTDPRGVRSGSVRNPFGVRSGSVRGPLGLRSGQFRTKISGAKNSKFQQFSICAAVAAAAGALRAAGLGMAARGAPPRRRWPHKWIFLKF